MLRSHPELANAPVGFGETPLFLLAESHRTKMVDLLVRFHASINAHDDKGETPLMLCGPRSPMFLELLRLGADINAQDKDGDTILHNFADAGDYYGDLKNIRWLVSHGARPDIKNHDGLTPLDLAAQTGSPKTVNILQSVLPQRHPHTK